MSKTLYITGFDSSVASPRIKEFIEMYTGEDSVQSLELTTRGPTARVQVQFTRVDDANILRIFGTGGLLFDNSLLEVNDRQNDADHTTTHHTSFEALESGILHVGCQLSKDMFGSLWSHEDVLSSYSYEYESFTFFLQSNPEYKLQLSHESIWQIELITSPDHPKKFLLIRVDGGPKIFKNEPLNVNAAPRWVRVTDFTPSLSFGHSTALCLEIPRHCNSFLDSINGLLVPIVDSPRSLPFGILFKVNSLIQHGCFPGLNLDGKFFRLVNPNKVPLPLIEHSLDKLFNVKDCCYDPVAWLCDQYRPYIASGTLPVSPYSDLDDGLVYIRRVRVTPTKLFFCGPEANLSNRVLRNYPDDVDNFLRVSFADEDFDRLRSNIVPSWLSSTEARRQAPIYKRIISTIRDGIRIGEKKFEFLGFSTSQLRENSLWMFASRPGLSAEDIRQWMGDFREIRNVAKYAARLGQSFSSSRETYNVPMEETECLPDVKTTVNGVEYVFSDGIGKISMELAQSIGSKLKFRSFFPSAFQIRYGGFKGVVAVDPNSDKKLSLRKSMKKFESASTSLDVLGWSKYQPCFLNREVITLLSTLGVEDRVFEKMQFKALKHLDSALTDPLRAYEALELTAPGINTQFLREMLKIGYTAASEPLLLMVLQTFRASKLLDLKTKTKIFVPKGRCMMGCLDETGELEYGEVFVQISRAKRKSIFDTEEECKNKVVRGRVAVAKNPCLHPGDVRVLTAVDKPGLHHLVDCVVFPQKGKRPHPNECSGSDLDGDLYFVTWDAELIPPQQFTPMDYSPPPCEVMDHDITIEEVQKFFADYFLNDDLGKICRAHTAFADMERSKAKSRKCLTLALLASIAVDFPKTGVPAAVPRELRVKKYPDFMGKADKLSYKSERVLGKLYRELVDIASPITSFTKDIAIRCYDKAMEIEGFEEYVDEAFKKKSQYDDRLDSLMHYYGIKTEAEIISGSILKTLKSFDRKNDLEEILMAVGVIKKKAMAWFDDGPDFKAQCKKASAGYYVTYHPKFWGRYDDGSGREHFLSFPWCAYGKLIDIKRKALIT